MISEFHSVLFKRNSSRRNNIKLINFERAVYELKDLYKKSIGIRSELKHLKLNMEKTKSYESLHSFQSAKMDEKGIEQQVTESINTLLDKHGRFNDKGL